MTDGCRILLLDDEPLILMDLEFAAEDQECQPLTATNVKEAMAHIEAQGGVSCAVLDVTLRDGETCMPVARELEKRDIPYLLHSGDLNRQEGTLAALNAQLIAKPACSQRVVETALALASTPPAQAKAN
ncbi:response regulator [Alteriqipengyuania lutimaris]|uniref:Response regulator n=1 Tax=Alteriqipengyuania lutimaris TaxID=1538146 RepID=A0A395LLB0_9SPHN|nr:response regulator [Alteriqipengyuania lutimaris]MBB3034967.1 DNA-binding NtrC family response regulator [Alteriqipengyuania lutimaris]RDS76214.1 response regulator [Alteriqipengyuania lutimaris]